MEKRMYMFVPYNISQIQAGIQAGHAALEYAREWHKSKLFIDFVENHKTWIILNGGTTRESDVFENMGDLNKILDVLEQHNKEAEEKGDKRFIQFSTFHEPDLNNALTAICFICDERVWESENYMDYLGGQDVETLSYEEWVNEIVGGEANLLLKEIITDKKLF